SAPPSARPARRTLLRAGHLLRRLAASPQSARSLRALPRALPRSESGPGMAGPPAGQTTASRVEKIAIIPRDLYGFRLARVGCCGTVPDRVFERAGCGASCRPSSGQRRGLAGAHRARAKPGEESEV